MTGFTFDLENPHDPDAVSVDYAIDWSPWLGAAIIDSAEWAVSGPDDEMTIANQSHTDSIATVFLTGGTRNRYYYARCHVTLDNGMEDDRTIRIRVKDR